MPSWTNYEFARRLDKVGQLQARLATAGVPREHPFWGSRRTLVLPADKEAFRLLLDAASRATARLLAADVKLARLLRLDPATDRAGCEVLLRASRRAATGLQLQGADVKSGEWQTRQVELQELLNAGTLLDELHRRYDETLTSEAWDQDLWETKQALSTVGGRWWRFLSVAYRRATRRVASICRETSPRGLGAPLALVDAVLEARRHRETLRRHEGLAGRLFGARWQAERSNWPALSKVGKWISQFHSEVRSGRIPAGIIDLLAERGLTSRGIGRPRVKMFKT